MIALLIVHGVGARSSSTTSSSLSTRSSEYPSRSTYSDRKRPRRRRNRKVGSGSFPHSFRPVEGARDDLRKYIRAYMDKVYPDGRQEEAMIKSILQNADMDAPWRASSLTQVWTPVKCSLTDIRFRIVENIHQGHRNHIYKVVDSNTGRMYVWKLFDSISEYTMELAFFTVANHPNIVRPVCTKTDSRSGYPGIVMEYVDGKRSTDYAHDHLSDRKVIIRLGAQVYDALKYMHWLGFIHADFKPENVMVNRHGDAKVIDYGFTLRLPFYKHNVGTPSTVAPEVLRIVDGPMAENIDYWALGSTIAQWFAVDHAIMGSGGKPRRWVPMFLSKAKGYMLVKPPPFFDDKLKQLMYYCMNPDSHLRQWSTVKQLRWFESLPFWEGFDFATLESTWYPRELPSEGNTESQPGQAEDFNEELIPSVISKKQIFYQA